jgi:hypothetical protein
MKKMTASPISGTKKKAKAEVDKIQAKGISAAPIKKAADATPNFVNDRTFRPDPAGSSLWKRTEDKGTNPSNKNVPKIGYRPSGGGGVRYQSMTNQGKMEYTYPKNFEISPNRPAMRYAESEEGGYLIDKKSTKSMPVKNEQVNTIMDSKNKNLKIGNAKKIEKYTK